MASSARLESENQPRPVGLCQIPDVSAGRRKLEILTQLFVGNVRIDDLVEIRREEFAFVARPLDGVPISVRALAVVDVARLCLAVLAKSIPSVVGFPGKVVGVANRLFVRGVANGLPPRGHMEALAEGDASLRFVGGIEKPGAEIVERVSGRADGCKSGLLPLLLRPFDHRFAVQNREADKGDGLQRADSRSFPGLRRKERGLLRGLGDV